jgi:hypothetical protein
MIRASLRAAVVGSWVLAAVAMAGLGGCASSGSGKGMEAGTALQSAADRVEQSRAKTSETLASMNDLVNNPKPDPRAQFDTFKTNEKDLEAMAKNASDTADKMKARGDDYFKQWEEDLGKIHNEDIKSSGASRRAERMAQFNQIQASYQQVKASASPFLADLKDIRTALSSDLSPQGISSMKPFADKANMDYQALDRSLGNLSQQFRAFGAQVSPVMPGK